MWKLWRCITKFQKSSQFKETDLSLLNLQVIYMTEDKVGMIHDSYKLQVFISFRCMPKIWKGELGQGYYLQLQPVNRFPLLWLLLLLSLLLLLLFNLKQFWLHRQLLQFGDNSKILIANVIRFSSWKYFRTKVEFYSCCYTGKFKEGERPHHWLDYCCNIHVCWFVFLIFLCVSSSTSIQILLDNSHGDKTRRHPILAQLVELSKIGFLKCTSSGFFEVDLATPNS